MLEADLEVSPRYRSHCRPGTGAASEKCQPATGATVSTMNRSRTTPRGHFVESRYLCPRLAPVAMSHFHKPSWVCLGAEPRRRTPSIDRDEHDGSAAGLRQG